MQYKILESLGVEIENTDDAAFNNFLVSGESGIIAGVLNECRLIDLFGTVVIDTGELMIQGFRIKITEAYQYTPVGTAASRINYQIVGRLTLHEGGDVSFNIVTRTISDLQQDDLHKLSSGIHEVELARFVHYGDNVLSLTSSIGFLSLAPILKPEFANSIDELNESGDKSKLYVLPDGFVYAYKLIETYIPGEKLYENLADPREEAGWVENSRFSSSGGISGATVSSGISNYITISKEQTVRVKGLRITSTTGTSITRSVFYVNEKVFKAVLETSVGTVKQYITDEGDGVYRFTVDDNLLSVSSITSSYSPTSMRIGGPLVGTKEDVIITINQEIKESEPTIKKEYKWTNTSIPFIPTDYSDKISELEEKTSQLQKDFINLKENMTDVEKENIPEYWEEHLSNKISVIKDLQKSGGKDCFSFISICDLHEAQNLGKITGLLARRVMDECDIKFALVLGDITTRESSATVDKLYGSFDSAFNILKPIISNALLAQGNHDGAYTNSSGTSYGENLSNSQIYDIMFRKVGLIGNVHFCDDGIGYYIDDTASRVRYVVLSLHNKLGTNANYFNTYRYGQSQFNLMVEALTTIPKSDWGIVFASHIPPVKKVDRHGDGIYEVDLSNSVPEQELLRNLVSAYTNRMSSFSGNYNTAGAWDHVSLSGINFSNSKGKFIGYFTGHLHADCLFSGEAYNFPVITTRCDGNNENIFSDNGTTVDEILREERKKGTTTEHSFDVFTINKSEGKIYATKIGAGNNRVIEY